MPAEVALIAGGLFCAKFEFTTKRLKSVAAKGDRQILPVQINNIATSLVELLSLRAMTLFVPGFN